MHKLNVFHKRVTYLNLLTSGELNTHLYQTEQAALQRLELLTKHTWQKMVIQILLMTIREVDI